MMMNFYRKSLHSLLALTATAVSPPTRLQEGGKDPPLKCGLGLIVAISGSIGDSSVTDILDNSPPSLSPLQPERKQMGFMDDEGGTVDRLMSCTESLGFESCNERSVENVRLEEVCMGGESTRVEEEKKKKERRSGECREFPPTLSTLDCNGQRKFILQPTRRDGRLELAKVRIRRPKILRAHRENGRLRLYLVENHDDELEEEVHGVGMNQEEYQEGADSDQCKVEDASRVADVSDDQSLHGTERRLRSCHEMVMNHQHPHHHHHSGQHHHLQLWSQRYVTTS